MFAPPFEAASLSEPKNRSGGTTAASQRASEFDLRYGTACMIASATEVERLEFALSVRQSRCVAL